MFGLCFGQSELTNQAQNFGFIETCHRLRRWPCSKQCRCDFIHLFVCALSTQENGDQKGERIEVVKGNRCFGVVLIKSLQNKLSPLCFAQDSSASQMAT